jgi:enediyne biosynthesis protein E4
MTSWGTVFFDYDRDGRVDLVIGNMGWDYRLLRNLTPLEDHHGISVRLVGGGAVNRDAVGSRVSVDTADGVTRMCEVMNGSSLGSGSDLACYFGVGSSAIERVRVWWLDGAESEVLAPRWDRELIIRREEPALGRAM